MRVLYSFFGANDSRGYYTRLALVASGPLPCRRLVSLVQYRHTPNPAGWHFRQPAGRVERKRVGLDSIGNSVCGIPAGLSCLPWVTPLHLQTGGNVINTISILGSGWLGLPLAERFAALGYRLKLSTTSPGRLQTLTALPLEAFIVDIGKPLDDIDAFLQSEVLIVNITSKDIDGFERLVKKIEASAIRAVLFVSSTSVYPNDCKVATELAGNELADHPLTIIENLFRENNRFSATIVRFAGLIGGDRHPGRFFRGGKTVKNPDASVNLIHRDDCIDILEQIVNDGIWGETFNACADSHPSKREFYSRAAAMAGAPLPVFEDSTDSAFKVVDNRKLKRVLDFDFRHPDLMAIRFDEAPAIDGV